MFHIKSIQTPTNGYSLGTTVSNTSLILLPNRVVQLSASLRVRRYLSPHLVHDFQVWNVYNVGWLADKFFFKSRAVCGSTWVIALPGRADKSDDDDESLVTAQSGNYLYPRLSCPRQHPAREGSLPRGWLAGYGPKQRSLAANPGLATRKRRIIDCHSPWNAAATTNAEVRWSYWMLPDISASGNLQTENTKTQKKPLRRFSALQFTVTP